ncbi:MAG: TonB-dependent receptor plug domain-containing protein [Myxococcota bacterium]
MTFIFNKKGYRRGLALALALLWLPAVASGQASEPEAPGTPAEESPGPESTPEGEDKQDRVEDRMLDEELQMLDEEVFAEDEPYEAEPGTTGAREPDSPATDEVPMPELREVTVRYSPEDIFRMGGSVQALDQKQLEQLQYDDPNAVLLQVPGVYIRQEDGFGLRPNIGLRGTDPNRSAKVTLMEDNVLFGPAPYSAPAAYYFPMMARITGVEVFKGPSAILYGPQTVAGAINYESRPVPEDPLGQIDLSYGRFQTIRGHIHYGRQNDWGGFIAEGVYLGTQGFKELDTDFGRDNTGFQKSEFSLKAFVNNKLSAHAFNRLTVKFVGSQEKSNETYIGLTDADFRDDPYQRYAGSQLDNMDFWRTAVSLRHNLAVGEHILLETTAYRHDMRRTWERANRFGDESTSADERGFVPFQSVLAFPDDTSAPPDPSFSDLFGVVTGARNSTTLNQSENIRVISNRRQFVVMGIQTRLRADFDTGSVHHEIESGLRFHYDSVNRFQPEQSYSMQNTQLVWDGQTFVEDPDLLITDNEGEAQALAGYLVWGLEIGGLVLKPGVRVEYIRTFFTDEKNAPDAGKVQDPAQTVALPGIGIQYTIFEGFAALAGVHRGFSAVAPGNSDTADPELSIAYEAGFRYVTKDGLGFGEAIGFFNDYSNILSLCTGSSGCGQAQVGEQFNQGRAFIGGVELLGGYNVPLRNEFNLPVRLSYTYTNAQYRSSSEEAVVDPVVGPVQRGDPIDFVPPHLLNVQVGVERTFWGIYTVGNYVSSFPEGVVRDASGNFVDLPETDNYFVLDLVGRVRFDPVEAYLRLQNITNTRAIVSRRPFGARPNAPFSFQIGVQVTF